MSEMQNDMAKNHTDRPSVKGRCTITYIVCKSARREQGRVEEIGLPASYQQR